MAPGQWLDFEDVERGTGDAAFAQRLVEVGEHHVGAAADIDKKGAVLHLLEFGGGKQPFGVGRLRRGGDDEIGVRQEPVERIGAVQFVDAFRRFLDAGVDADGGHAPVLTLAGGFGADAADADDQRGRLGQVGRGAALAALAPVAFELVAEVAVHAARKGQHEGHDVGGDMVVVDAADIGHSDVAGDQLGEVIALGRPGRWRGQPFEVAGRGQQLGI